MPSHVRAISHLPTIGPGRARRRLGVRLEDCAVPESSDPQPAIRPPITSTINALDAIAILLADTNALPATLLTASPAKSTSPDRICCFPPKRAAASYGAVSGGHGCCSCCSKAAVLDGGPIARRSLELVASSLVLRAAFRLYKGPKFELAMGGRV